MFHVHPHSRFYFLVLFVESAINQIKVLINTKKIINYHKFNLFVEQNIVLDLYCFYRDLSYI
jgi:hypothetical protein